MAQATKAASKKRKLYWFTSNVTSKHQGRALTLSRKGFDVQFFSTLEDLTRELQIKRVGIIIVGDDGPEPVIENFIMNLLNLPEIQGVKLILSTVNLYPKVMRIAAAGNFRDILPMDLVEEHWLSRFIFATSSKNLSYNQPSPQITMNNSSTMSFPARICWITAKRIWIECRVSPPVGAKLYLNGNIAEAFGTTNIPLTISETHRSNLNYRFSDAIVATWSIPEDSFLAAKQLLQTLKTCDVGPRCKTFICVKSAQLRSSLFAKLNGPKYDVNIALQKQSILEEPKFFSPDVVIIEDLLTVGTNEQIFLGMLENIPEYTTILVVGPQAIPSKIQDHPHAKKIHFLSKIPNNLAEAIEQNYLPPSEAKNSKADDDAIYITSEDQFSFAEVTIPVRLYRLHPQACQIAMPYKVGNFTLGRLDAPLLRELIGRAPYCKFTEVYPDSRQTPTKFPLIADAYLADIDDIDRKKIGQSLTNIVAKKFRATLPVEQITQSMPDTSAEEEFNQTRTAAVSVKDENFEIQESGDNESLFPEDFSVGKISQEITDTFAEVGKWCSQHKASIATVIIVVGMFIVLFVSLDKIAREGGLQMGSEYVKTLKMFNPKKFNKKKKQQP